MEKCQFQEKFPIYVQELPKSETAVKTLDDLCLHFNDKIQKHPFAKHLQTFDHCAHTEAIEGATIDETIIGAKVVLFCFGKKFLDPRVLAVRPRGIGICETESNFVISFLEAPNPALTETMTQWVRDLEAETKEATKRLLDNLETVGN